MKYARGPAQPVNVFRKKDGESAKVISQSFHAWLGGAIETKIANALTKLATGEVGDVVADAAAERAGKNHPGKTVIAEKGFVGEDAGQQQREVALNHYEAEDRVETIATDEVVKEIEMHD